MSIVKIIVKNYKTVEKFLRFLFQLKSKINFTYCKIFFTFVLLKNYKMNTLQLFPNRFKIIGWFIFIPSLILGLISLSGVMNFEISLPVIYNSGIFNDENQGFLKTAEIDLFPNLFGILIIIGGIMVGFSKEKIEDEYISSLRLKSVFWSLIVSYSIVLLLFITVFGSLFLTVMILIMFLPLVLYIFRFNYLLLKK